jgi:ribose-phosphate pyrophosphokinase
MKQMVFSGRSCPKLAQAVIKHNRLRPGELESLTFANSEIKVRLLSKVKGNEVIIVQSITNPANDNLIELLFILDALVRENAKSVTLLIPYFGYSRQNLQHLPGECVSLNVVVRILEALGAGKIITVDIHDEASSGIFNIPFTNLSALPILAKQIRADLKINKDNESKFIIASPDQGGVERARTFAEHFYSRRDYPEIAVVEKKRDLTKIHQSKAVAIFGEVKKKQVILVDDVATSGRTIINAANLCLQAGAISVRAAVVHPDFGKGVPQKIQDSSFKSFYITNTIEAIQPNLKLFPKIKAVDIAKLLVF